MTTRDYQSSVYKELLPLGMEPDDESVPCFFLPAPKPAAFYQHASQATRYGTRYAQLSVSPPDHQNTLLRYLTHGITLITN